MLLDSPLKGIKVPEAEPIITDKKIKSDPAEGNVFRYVGFGKARL